MKIQVLGLAECEIDTSKFFRFGKIVKIDTSYTSCPLPWKKVQNPLKTSTHQGGMYTPRDPIDTMSKEEFAGPQLCLVSQSE